MTPNLCEVREGDILILKYRPGALKRTGKTNLEKALRGIGVLVVWVPISDESHPPIQGFLVVRGEER